MGSGYWEGELNKICGVKWNSFKRQEMSHHISCLNGTNDTFPFSINLIFLKRGANGDIYCLGGNRLLINN